MQSKYIKIISSLGVAVFAFVAVFVASHADAQVSTTTNATTTTATTTVAAPVISNITTSPANNGSSAVIMWSTDANSTSQVAYGTTTPYTIYSIFDPSLNSSHSLTLSSLTPNTLYHFQVISGNSNGNVTNSADQTFMTAIGTSTTSTTTSTTTSSTNAPVFSSIMSAGTNDGTGATITWVTDQPSTSQVSYGTTTNNMTSTIQDPNLVSNHTVTISNLMPGITYFYTVMSNNGSGVQGTSASQSFVSNSGITTGTTSTTTSTTTTPANLQALENLILQIQQELNQLLSQFRSLGGTLPNNGNTGTPVTTTGAGMITPTNLSVVGGGSIDFTGRNFGIEEPVRVILNGNTVTTSHADGGGNFSTGSLSIPAVASSTVETYTFTGQNSGITGSATVTVMPM